jgi:hypothetical protein
MNFMTALTVVAVYPTGIVISPPSMPEWYYMQRPIENQQGIQIIDQKLGWLLFICWHMKCHPEINRHRPRVVPAPIQSIERRKLQRVADSGGRVPTNHSDSKPRAISQPVITPRYQRRRYRGVQCAIKTPAVENGARSIQNQKPGPAVDDEAWPAD